MGEIQEYIAAFSFGLLVQASIAAVLLYSKGHVSTIRKDSRRLALVSFLAFAALWAQFDFINFVIPFPNVAACQVTVIISTIFDQAARITIGGFLLWSIGHASKSSAETYGLGGLMGIRVVAGVVFVGFTRPQFESLCVARSLLLPPPISVLAIDVIIIGVLVIRVYTMGFLEAICNTKSTMIEEQSKAFVYCIAGFLIWTLTSSAMLLGLPTVMLLLRTGLPAVGLIVLISIITLFPNALMLPRGEDISTPESRSPFVAPNTRSLGAINGGNGSPANIGYMRTANLFVVNPSLTPRASPIIKAPVSVEADDGVYVKYPAELDIVDTLQQRESIKPRNPSSRFRSEVGKSIVTDDSMAGAAQMGEMGQTRMATMIDIKVQDKSSRASTFPAKERKRYIFGRSKHSLEIDVRKIGISNPVMVNSESLTTPPLPRVRTVDLATATANERARREDEVVKSLIPMRPAPPPPTKTTSTARRKTINERRSETSGRTPVPMITITSGKSSFDSSRLSVYANASSTSASISPGREDVRRRSPRATKNVTIDNEKVGLPSLAPRYSNIRHLEKPLPLSMVVSDDEQRAGMHVKSAVNDYPGGVKSIISAPPSILFNTRALPDLNVSPESPKSPVSVLNRPRPYRRKSEKNRHQSSPRSPSRHRQQKSTSVINPNPNEMSTAPLSELPTTASRLERLLPNNIHSTSVEEMISLLFPAPPGVHGIPNRRSSVPSIPRIPSSILQSDSFGQLLTEQELQERRDSRRRTFSFSGLVPSEVVTSMPIAEITTIRDRNAELFISQNTEAISEEAYDAKESRKSTNSNSSSETNESNDDSKSAWASIHSPIPAIDVTMVQQTARETYIQLRKHEPSHAHLSKQELDTSLKLEHDQNEIGNEDAFMTVMLDLDTVIGQVSNFQIVSADKNMEIFPTERIAPISQDTWHRRIGDELPTFSQRRNFPTSRTVSPPAALHLHTGKRATVVDRKPATAITIESPREALKTIQAQLDNFEWPGTESSASNLTNQPQLPSKLATSTENDQLGLLADLEREMNQQESHWMQMHHNFDRDSNSVIMTPSEQDTEPRALPSPPPDDPSGEMSQSRQRRYQSDSKGDLLFKLDKSSLVTARRLHTARSNMWQQRLAEAQIEYMENLPALKGNLHVNFLSFSKAQQLGSPTPPDSLDSASEDGVDEKVSMDTNDNTVQLHKCADLTPKSVMLWQSKPLPQTSMIDYLWAPQIRSTTSVASLVPAAELFGRLKRRAKYSLSSLPITSTKLWSKPIVKATRNHNGLWKSTKARPKSIIIRPRTQKPQRKSKRMTCLPDILESPSPLPHKRDTLGIFQFPWGEKSDSAVYEPLPVPNRAKQSSLTMNSTLKAPSHQINQELVEYSSSFFDDYDDVYDLDSINTSDDEFDETTLWDIASLLNSTSIPSKNSLLPPLRIIEDYDDTDDSDQDSVEEDVISNLQMVPPPRPSTVEFPIQLILSETSTADTEDQTDLSLMALRSYSGNSDTWQAFLPSLDDAVRATSIECATEASMSLVDKKQLLDKALPSLPLEEMSVIRHQQDPNDQTPEFYFDGLASASSSYTGLWTAQATAATKIRSKLWTAQPSDVIAHSLFESSLKNETHLRKAIKSVNPAPIILSKLESTSLWTPYKDQLSTNKHWLHATTLTETNVS